MNKNKETSGFHIKSVGKKFFNALRGKTSVSDIVKTVAYNDLNQNKIEDKIPVLNSEISHIYMGKINEEEDSIYSDDFLKGILEYYFYCTPKGEKVTLELANCVSETLGENMQGFMDFDKQKEYIIDFVENNFKKDQFQRLEIIDLETRHPDLFEGLKEYENTIDKEASQLGLSKAELEKTPSFDKLDFLNTGTTPSFPDEGNPFSSLDIVKYLYRVCQSNKIFFDKVRAIKPEKAKSDYYPIIEIAIRMADLLHGIRIQGGAMKQKHYDAVIREIINPYINISQYPELNKLRNFCIKKLGDKAFETLYIDTKKYRLYGDKIRTEKQENSAKRRITGTTAGTLGLALGAVLWANHHDVQKLQQQTQETIKEIFENKKVEEYGEMGSSEYIGERKVERINEHTDNIYKRFVFRYGSIGGFNEKGFKAKIIDCLNNQEVLKILGDYSGSEILCNEDRIIDEYLIPQNIGEFRINNIPDTPYEKLLPYLDNFINTILLEKDIESNREEKYTTMQYRGMANAPAVKDIGEYAPKEVGYYGGAGQRYRFALTDNPTSSKHYILATSSYYGDFSKKDNDKLSTYQSKDLAIDFLKQTQPVINEVLDQYLMRYYTWENSHYMTSHGPAKNRLRGDIERLLIKDFLRKGLLKRIHKNQPAKIINYLDEFIIENHDTLSGLSDVNKNMIPNGFLQEYEEAMQNTIDGKDKVFGDYAWLPVSNGASKDNIVSHLGKYRTSDGKLYRIGVVKIKGKKYLYAEEDGRLDFGDKSYGYYHGEIVAKDYFETKAKFLQKKILLEKKLKSASQKHVDIPANGEKNKFSNYVKNNPKGIVPR